MLTALRSAAGVLTRFSAEAHDEWDAVRTTPVVLPVVGVIIGLVAGITLLVPAPLATPPALYLGTLYLLTGTTHLRGLASVASTATENDESGAALVTVVLVVVALALGAFSLVGTGGGGLGGLAGASITLSLVVASEVSATAGMATLLARGVGAASSDENGDDGGETESDPAAFLPVAVVLLLCVAVVPAVARPAVVATLAAGILVALAVGGWARGRPAVPDAVGTSGTDVLGAARELGRVVGVHVGVVVWTLV
jgi:adenosylcobinamide-GDP ribazoletransferase